MSDAKFYPQSDWYFSSAAMLVRLLRFLNLMEPDRTVLSITKCYMWVSVLLLVSTWFTGGDIEAVMIAGGNQIAALVALQFRRWERMDKLRHKNGADDA